MELLQLEYRSLKERTQQLTIEISKKSAEIERIKLRSTIFLFPSPAQYWEPNYNYNFPLTCSFRRYDMVASTLITENGPSETSEAYFIIKVSLNAKNTVQSGKVKHRAILFIDGTRKRVAKGIN